MINENVRRDDPCHSMSSRIFPTVRAVLCVLAIGTITPSRVAHAEESEFCRQLAIVVAHAPEKFRKLRTTQFDNALESFETSLNLPGMEACRIDGITPGYFCMVRGLDNQAGAELAGELVQRVHSCYPHVRAQQQVDPASPVHRLVTDWVLDTGARIRIVQRTYREHRGSVFLYVR